MLSYTELNTKLVEEFGRLETLCNQIYNDKHGVTAYINEMDTIRDAFYICNWEGDLRKLKDVRHKRNSLSHGQTSFNLSFAKQDDIDFVMDFRNRIINANDPLTQYRRDMIMKSSSTSPKIYNRRDCAYTPNPHPKSQRKPIGCGLYLLLISLATVAIAWLLF